eukprot:SAG22_NODE_12654_length_434_cov_1.083582_1_plen_49_part_01
MLPHDVHDPVHGCVADAAWASAARDSPLPSAGIPKPANQSCPGSPLLSA